MACRGCVAVATSEGWRGVDGGADGMPTKLGREVWDHLHDVVGGYAEGALRDLRRFSRLLVLHGRWADYLASGTCRCCGKNDLTQQVTHATVDAMCTEWVYVVDPAMLRLVVMVGVEDHRRGATPRPGFDVAYGHAVVARYDLFGSDPEWSWVAERGSRIRAGARDGDVNWARYSTPGAQPPQSVAAADLRTLACLWRDDAAALAAKARHSFAVEAPQDGLRKQGTADGLTRACLAIERLLWPA